MCVTVRVNRRRGGAALVVIALAGVLLTTTACRPPESADAAVRATRATGKWNVILISLDTLRADHLSCYGYHRDTSPALDALAAGGARFELAIAESPWTTPSHMTMFTGLYATTHGVHFPGAWLAYAIPTLPEILQQNGYRTLAFTGGGNVSKRAGFDRGFEHFYVKDQKGLGDALDHARDYLDSFKPGERFFFFIHAYDVHAPYERREPHASRYVSADAEPFDAWQENELNLQNDGFVPSPGNIKFLVDHYDGGIRRADELLGAFFEDLRRRHLFENSVIVFVSDHGEEFGEHGSLGHYVLHRECLHVPMIMVAPGLKPQVIKHGVGLKDLMPTVLELVQVTAPACQGRSLMPLLNGGSMEPWPLISEQDKEGSFRSLIWDDKHLILRAYSDRARLYDWRTDPTEQVNLAGARSEQVAELWGRFPELPVSPHHPDFPADKIPTLARRWSAQGGAESAASTAADGSDQEGDEELRKLKSLGYAGP